MMYIWLTSNSEKGYECLWRRKKRGCWKSSEEKFKEQDAIRDTKEV